MNPKLKKEAYEPCYLYIEEYWEEPIKKEEKVEPSVTIIQIFGDEDQDS